MKSPKAEFNRLALDHLGWAPAGQKWCSSWKEYFGEEYVWNGHATNAAAAQTTTELSAPLGASSTASDNVSGEVVLSGSSISVLCLLRLAAAAAATTTAAVRTPRIWPVSSSTSTTSMARTSRILPNGRNFASISELR
ncbi:hypothetical protein PMIN07_005790 [Paraphaeosphaeria minitans]